MKIAIVFKFLVKSRTLVSAIITIKTIKHSSDTGHNQSTLSKGITEHIANLNNRARSISINTLPKQATGPNLHKITDKDHDMTCISIHSNKRKQISCSPILESKRGLYSNCKVNTCSDWSEPSSQDDCSSSYQLSCEAGSECQIISL